ncbi:hypothetical protein [Actinomadura rudentiformis]|uniref:Uncharacterized protein n=1 Tax=Actinomadura rudentiformis TaxID=359158 RepID=A0A6H9YRI9_9ACTN|nr:hypothetical protein [Actinomadura rudentiformis]KAB2345676.1 hypothetical protein F8566_27460 [Actinomadura rudentiformis]
MSLPYDAKHSGPRWRGPVSLRQFSLHSAIRATTSVLVTGSAALYLTVAFKGLLLLTAPPAQMVMTDTRPQHPGRAVTESAPGIGPSTLYGPLAIAGALIAGLLLVWAGTSGLRTFRDQREWRRRQGLPLVAYALGAIAFGLAHLSVSGGHMIWNGPNPVVPSALLGLLVATATLALPAGHPSKDSMIDHMMIDHRASGTARVDDPPRPRSAPGLRSGVDG